MASGSLGYYTYTYRSSFLDIVGKWWIDAAVLISCALTVYFQHWTLYLALTIGAVYFSVRALRCDTKKDLISEVLSFSPLTYLGKISYGIYLFHLPLLFAFRSILPDASHYFIALITTIATICLASLSFHFLENPLRKIFRSVRGSHSKLTSLQ